MADSEVHRAILAAWRIEQPRLVARLARMLRDTPLAEELTQDVLVVALEQWPQSGVPERPGAWLMAAAQHRALDHLRRAPMLDRRHRLIAATLEAEQNAVPYLDAYEDFGDEMLRLIFTACHPRLSPEGRVALALRMVCGLTTGEIGRAFLLPEPVVAQRIVRAKRVLAESGLSYETPQGQERERRIPTALEVIYLIFNEGYTASRGEDLIRPRLCDEARRLGRVLTGLLPDHPEAHGLVALMEINAARAAARVDVAGDTVLLRDQDRRLWDPLLIRRGLDALGRAQSLSDEAGFYTLQAGIAACHACANDAADTNWHRIADLYLALSLMTGSPIVELNRAVAVSMTEGAAAGLKIVERLAEVEALKSYHLLPSVRGELLERSGRFPEARAAFIAAAALTANARERTQLERRAAACSMDQ